MCDHPDYFIEKVKIEGKSFNDNFELKDLNFVNIFIGENSSGKSNIIRAITNNLVKSSIIPKKVEIKIRSEATPIAPKELMKNTNVLLYLLLEI